MVTKQYSTFLTPSGLKNLKNKIQKLEKEIIPKLQKDLERARADGDYPENNPWILAQEELINAHYKLAQLKEALRTAKIIKPKGNKVVLGSIVKIKLNNKTIKTITLTSSIEADPANNKISVDSPIGQAILGAKKGDTLTLKNNTTIKILEILHK